MHIFAHRAWAVLPLTFFALKAWQYGQRHELFQLWWFCNASNLLLAAAIALRLRNLIFICAVLLAIGLPIWVFDFIVNGDFHPFSVLTHTLSPALGFLVARRLGWSGHVTWQVAVYYLLLQFLARLLTPPALNINVAFAVYAPVRPLFSSFLLYSAVNLAGLIALTWLLSKLLKTTGRTNV